METSSLPQAMEISVARVSIACPVKHDATLGKLGLTDEARNIKHSLMRFATRNHQCTTWTGHPSCNAQHAEMHHGTCAGDRRTDGCGGARPLSALRPTQIGRALPRVPKVCTGTEAPLVTRAHMPDAGTAEVLVHSNVHTHSMLAHSHAHPPQTHGDILRAISESEHPAHVRARSLCTCACIVAWACTCTQVRHAAAWKPGGSMDALLRLRLVRRIISRKLPRDRLA